MFKELSEKEVEEMRARYSKYTGQELLFDLWHQALYVAEMYAEQGDIISAYSYVVYAEGIVMLNPFLDIPRKRELYKQTEKPKEQLRQQLLNFQVLAQFEGTEQ